MLRKSDDKFDDLRSARRKRQKDFACTFEYNLNFDVCKMFLPVFA